MFSLRLRGSVGIYRDFVTGFPRESRRPLTFSGIYMPVPGVL
jgi:hypothetical protein